MHGPTKKRVMARSADAVAEKGRELTPEDACVKAISNALSAVDSELGDLVFDGLLRLIAAFVPHSNCYYLYHS